MDLVASHRYRGDSCRTICPETPSHCGADCSDADCNYPGCSQAPSGSFPGRLNLECSFAQEPSARLSFSLAKGEGVQEFFVAEGFRQIIDCAGFHRLYTSRHAGTARNKNNLLP